MEFKASLVPAVMPLLHYTQNVYEAHTPWGVTNSSLIGLDIMPDTVNLGNYSEANQVADLGESTTVTLLYEH